MDLREPEGIVCFSEKEADVQRKQLEREGYGTKVVILKDGRHVVYTVGEKWEWRHLN